MIVVVVWSYYDSYSMRYILLFMSDHSCSDIHYAFLFVSGRDGYNVYYALPFVYSCGYCNMCFTFLYSFVVFGCGCGRIFSTV